MSKEFRWKISTQQIAIFLKSMELRNLRQVADFYNYTPSTVSKTIMSLEEELGFRLFARSTHGLVPTAAAEQLSKDWRLLLGSINNSIIRAKKKSEMDHSRLTVGIVDSANEVDSLVREAILSFKEKHPDIVVQVEKHDMHRLVELLNMGMLDVVYSSAIEIPYLKDYQMQWEEVKQTRAAVFVPRKSAFFQRDSLELGDLADADIAALDPLMHPSYTRWLNDLCASAGFIPKVVSTFRTVRSLRFSLSLNREVFIGETITKEWEEPDIRVFPLQETSFTLLAWRSDAGEDLLALKDLLKNMLK